MGSSKYNVDTVKKSIGRIAKIIDIEGKRFSLNTENYMYMYRHNRENYRTSREIIHVGTCRENLQTP